MFLKKKFKTVISTDMAANEWMNECLMTPQHGNWSAIGCQNKVDAWNGYRIKNFKILKTQCKELCNK